jgi:hypothetical protein
MALPCETLVQGFKTISIVPLLLGGPPPTLVTLLFCPFAHLPEKLPI